MEMDPATLEDSQNHDIRRRDVGGTGVLVCPIALDGAPFGWVAGVDESSRILDVYAAGGGNFVSTADHYAGGRSEIMIGSWLRTVTDRSSVVLETRIGKHPDAAGLSNHSMLRAVENSLTRLGTDYLDFLSLDGEDPLVPIEESLETGFRLIREGKVRFLSANRFSAESLRTVAAMAEESGGPAFRAILIEYSLMERTAYEHEYQAIATGMGRGALARLPLAHGYLAGEFRTRDEVPSSILFDGAARHIGRHGERVLEALASVARDLGESPVRVALAWVLVKPGIAAAVLRPKNAEQLEHEIAAPRVQLERHHVALLDRASA
jgi:aryl-alcohol dehydrogenase-like predicted oxidoreductase